MAQLLNFRVPVDENEGVVKRHLFVAMLCSTAWISESEITTAAGVTYKYDGDGNRLVKSSGKAYWYGAGSEILDESALSGNITNEYVFFGGKRIAMRTISSGTIYYYQ